MNVSDLFTALSYGELGNLSIGMDGSGSIRTEDQPRIVTLANQALTEIYTRLRHRRDFIDIALDENRNRYPLRRIHAVSDTDPANTVDRFILDSATEPYDGLLVKVLDVKLKPASDPDTTISLPINDRSRNDSVRMLEYDVLWLASPVTGDVLTIEYQAGHPRLSVNPVDPAEAIFLAPGLDRALQLYIASRVYSSMNGDEHITKSRLLMSQFYDIITQASSDDLLQTSSSGSQFSRLAAGGWLVND